MVSVSGKQRINIPLDFQLIAQAIFSVPRHIELFGLKIKVYGPRLKTIAQNPICQHCGREGKVFYLERHKSQGLGKYSGWHLNLYAKGSRGYKILMTRDHIFPASLGGSNSVDNSQTLCNDCNSKKGNKIMDDKFDIIGDIHGCFGELCQLMDDLGHDWDAEKEIHIPSRKIIFIGDIADRGPNSARCIKYAMDMVKSNNAYWIMGNHCNKLMRWAKGNNVVLSHGLDKTVLQINKSDIDRKELYSFLSKLPYYLDFGDLIVAHAAWNDEFKNAPYSGKVRSICLYGPTTGKIRDDGHPDRIDWPPLRQNFEDGPYIVYGHQVFKDVKIENKTIGIDTGCVFGGKLTALRWPELEIKQVEAFDVWDKSKPELLEE